MSDQIEKKHDCKLRLLREKFDAGVLHDRPGIELKDGYCGIRDTLRLQFLDGDKWVDVPIVSEQ